MSVPSASQTVGPFFKFALDRPSWNDLTSDGPLGERIRIAGRVLDGDGAPVPDALLEIWQANAAGRYAHPSDDRAAPLDPKFRGFGRASTDADGHFAFTTVRPGTVPDAAGVPQAPHVNVSIFARGLLIQLHTRIYFGDRADENARDPLLASIADAAVRATLVAVRENAGDEASAPAFRFDVILQGARETAFLDV